MLGTGSADGWPNPFCECRSCRSERSRGRSRGCSCVLVDDRILIDCGPTAPAAAARAGISLEPVEHVLLTHGHPDHLAPAFLLSRQWVAGLADLHVWGPPSAIDLCRDWLGPRAGIHLHLIAPGEEHALETAVGPYLVRVVDAAHHHGDGDVLAKEAVLFDITAPRTTTREDADGRSARLLYATDTGPLSAEALEAVRDREFSLVLVDATFGPVTDHGTGHLDFDTLPAVLADLASVGAISPDSDVVATHLSHHNPPMPELAEILGSMGIRVVEDLDVISVGEPIRPRHHLVIGGARSGKSTHAEALANRGSAAVLYLATAPVQPGDTEWEERIAAHRDRRPRHWQTIESLDIPTALEDAAPGTTVLVDCMGMWLTGHLDQLDGWSDVRSTAAAARQQVLARVDELVASLARTSSSVIIVSNEVGAGVVPATPSGRLFRDLLGVVNARLAQACHDCTLVVAGRPLPLPAKEPGLRP